MNIPIKVVIADDHDLIRKGLVAVLRSYPILSLVGEASNGAEAVHLCNSVQPDVVLMDLVMPEMDGVQAISAIRQQYPQTKIVVLSSFSTDKLVEEAIRAGAISYLMKNVSGDELLNAIQSAHEGKSILAREAAQVLVHVAYRSTVDYQLTSRENEVLALMVEGLTNQQLAMRLSISISTAKKHVHNVITKLGVTNRTEATSMAIQQELVKRN
jgi:two-component system, NarL family, response regulator LiaR